MLRNIFIFTFISLICLGYVIFTNIDNLSSIDTITFIKVLGVSIVCFIVYIILYKILEKFVEDNPEKDIEFVHTLHAQANAKVSNYIYMLYSVVVLFFISAIFWAYISEIDELTRGEGKVIPSEKLKVIQSLDGGVVDEILVKEGSYVKKNQPLMKIDTTRFKAALDENKNALEDLQASIIRLEAESKIDLTKKITPLKFPENLLSNHSNLIELQKKLYQSRYDELKSEINTLELQVNQKKQEYLEVVNKEEQLSETLKLMEQELDTAEKLVARKAKSNMELISLKREYSGIKGDYNAARLSIPRIQLSIKESKNKIDERIKAFKSEVARELQEINGKMKMYQSKVVSEKDKLDKTVIVSPVNGTIKQINLNTKGGVVRTGADLIEIVPESEILQVEAKIDPKDIAFINPNQKAIVKITAYDFSIYGGLEASIVEISADSIKDEDSRDGKTYYKVVVQTEKNYLEKNGERLSIIPGMIASVDIVTGKKTVLDYILKPILKTKDSALRER